jgi:hypothetical protein
MLSTPLDERIKGGSRGCVSMAQGAVDAAEASVLISTAPVDTRMIPALTASRRQPPPSRCAVQAKRQPPLSRRTSHRQPPSSRQPPTTSASKHRKPKRSKTTTTTATQL